MANEGQLGATFWVVPETGHLFAFGPKMQALPLSDEVGIEHTLDAMMERATEDNRWVKWYDFNKDIHTFL